MKKVPTYWWIGVMAVVIGFALVMVMAEQQRRSKPPSPAPVEGAIALSVPLVQDQPTAVADQGQAENDALALKSLAVATEAETKDVLFWEIEQPVPDINLRRSMSKLLQLTEAYEVPKEGDGDVDMALQMCMEGRRVFALCERHQLLWGLESFENLRPVVEQVMQRALDKLNWVHKRGTRNTEIVLIRRSVERRLISIASGKLIERAGFYQ